MFKFKEYKYKSFNFILLISVYAVGILGVFLIRMLQDEGENLYQKQLKGYIAGLVIILVVSMVDYHFMGKCFILAYLLSLSLLLICRFSNSYPIYGWSHYTARRWIKIGGDPTAGIHNTGFEFQPSEITKICMIIFMAKFFELCYKYIKKIWVFIAAAVLMAIPTLLILTQTDLSTSIVFVMVFLVMVFASGVPYKFILPAVGTGAALIAGFIWYIQQDFQVIKILEDYQMDRIMAALHPEEYPELMYQQANAKVAIQSGGMLGKYLTGDVGIRGTSYVPVVESDFIFSAVAEEFGFIGSMVVIGIYILMIAMIIKIARQAKDYLGMMIALGIGALITFQVFINIGVVTSLLPNTGIPLPFMSAGLTSLLINLVLIGILLNISMQPKEKIEKAADDFIGLQDFG